MERKSNKGNKIKYNPVKINCLKEICPAGTKITLHNMSDENQMPSGLTGVVQFIDDAAQIHVNWSNGSTLAVVLEVDSFSIASAYDSERR